MKYHKSLFFNRTIEYILTLIQTNQPVEIIHFPASGISKSLDILESISENLGITFITFDCSVLREYEEISDELLLNFFNSQISAKNTDNSSRSDNLNYRIQKIVDSETQKKNKVIFLFKYIDPRFINGVFEFKNLLLFIDHLRANYDVNYLLCSYEDIFNEKNRISLPLIPTYFCPNDIIDSRSYIKDFICKECSLECNDENLQLVQYEVGIPHVLLKRIWNNLKIQNLPLTSIFEINSNSRTFFDSYPLLKGELFNICHALPTNDLNLLIDIANNKVINIERRSTIDKLQKLGVLGKDELINSNLLKNFLRLFQKEILGTNSFIEITSSIRINPVTYEIFDVEKSTNIHLTKIEFDILCSLIENKPKPLSREAIAEMIWGKSYLQNYSNWAVEKTISRIREKLGDKKPFKIIRTFPKRGFVIN